MSRFLIKPQLPFAHLSRTFVFKFFFMAEKKLHFDIEGMSCVHCRNTVAKAIRDVKGVLKAEVDLANHTADIEYDDVQTSPERIVDAVNSTGVYRVKE